MTYWRGPDLTGPGWGDCGPLSSFSAAAAQARQAQQTSVYAQSVTTPQNSNSYDVSPSQNNRTDGYCADHNLYPNAPKMANADGCFVWLHLTEYPIDRT